MKKIYILIFAIFIGNIANAQNWQPLGPDDFNQASKSTVENTEIAFDNNNVPYIVYIESNKITVKKFFMNKWTTVGDSMFSAGTASFCTIDIDLFGTPYVAYSDVAFNSKVIVKKFNGTNWVDVGTAGISNGIARYSSIAIDNSGIPYVVFCDNGSSYNLSVKKFNGNNWVYVGSPGFSGNKAYDSRIAIDSSGTPYVIFKNNSINKRATVMKFNGSLWVNVGSSGISVGQVNYTSIDISKNGIPYITYCDEGINNIVVVKKFNGINWENLGTTSISDTIAGFPTIKIDTSNTVYVAFNNYYNNENICVKKFNGSIWINVGNTNFSSLSPSSISLAFDNTGIPYVVYKESAHTKAVVKKYSGNSWDDVGSTCISNGFSYFSKLTLSSSGIPFIVYSDYSIEYKACVKKFINGSWVYVGLPGFSDGQADYTSIALDSMDNPYVAYKDYGNSKKITVKKFNGTSWVTIGNQGFSISEADFINIELDANGTPYVAYRDLGLPVTEGTYGNIVIKKFDGNIWSIVGNYGFSIGSSDDIKIKFDNTNTPFVAYVDAGNNYYTTVKKYNGSSWINVGNAGLSDSAMWCKAFAISKQGIPYVACSKGNVYLVKKFIGNNWVNVGNGGFLVNTLGLYPSMVIDANEFPYISYSANYPKVSVKKFDGNNWIVLGSLGLSCDIATYTSLAIDSNSKVYLAYSSMGVWAKTYNQCNNPTNGGIISGNQTICIGTTPVAINSLMNPNGYSGAINFKWQKSTTSGNSGFIDIPSSNSASYNPGNITQTTWFKRLSNESCDTLWSIAGESNVILINVINMPPATDSIIGLSSVCQGQNNVVYTATPFANATSYIWTLPAGATGITTTNTITVNYGTSATSGNITVKGNNACGNGDSSILAVNVNVLPGVAGIISGISTVCQGQNSITYTTPAITNATSYSWTLPNGVIGTSTTNTITVDYGASAVSGDITVKGNNSCGDGISSSIQIIVKPIPATPIITQTGNTLLSNISTGNQWYNLTSGLINNATLQIYNPVQIGNYFAVVTQNGCSSDSSNIIFYDNTGINEKKLYSDGFNIYPNPAKENLIIELIESNISQNTTISIYNIQGQLCRQIISNQPKTEVDIKDLSAGLYFVKLNNEKESFVSRFVKE